MSDTNTETAGGTRFSEGKPGMWWAAPLYGLRLVAKVTEAGSGKYAPRDWYEGQSFSTLLDSMFRHTLDVMLYGPTSRDEETGLYNLAHAAWNILALLTFLEEGREEELDDVTPWFGVTTQEKRAAEEAAEQYENADVLDLLRTRTYVVESSDEEAHAWTEGVAGPGAVEQARAVDKEPLDPIDGTTPAEELAAQLEELGYDARPSGYSHREVYVDGHANNPDPTFEERSKLVSQAYQDLRLFFGELGEDARWDPARVGANRIRLLARA
jgi:hypothetical protein